MRPVVLLLAFALLAGVGPRARAQAVDLRARQAELGRLTNDWSRLDERRRELERASQEQAARIDRLKAQPAGVRRDLELGEQLSASKARTDELGQLAAQLRARAAAVEMARRAFIAECDRALAGSLTESQRLEIERWRTTQVALLAAPAAPLGIGKVAVDPLDGPRELEEKADLLRDSEDKLRREMQRLATRIDHLERRRHLRERAGAVDDDLFGESLSNRKMARASTLTLSPGDHAAAPSQGGGATGQPPGSGPPTGGGAGGTNGPGGSTTGLAGDNTDRSESTVLRNLVDPSTLEQLRRADGDDDVDRRAAALRRARGELEGMASELSRRARALSTRAEDLRRKK